METKNVEKYLDLVIEKKMEYKDNGDVNHSRNTPKEPEKETGAVEDPV